MNHFNKAFENALKNSGGISGTHESIEFVEKVDSAIDIAIKALNREAAHRINVSEDYLKGWLAEQWHAETLNVSAQARNRSDIWASVQGNNRPGEDILYGNSSSSKIAEVKYYKSGEATAKAVSRPAYEGHSKIIPSDQKESVRSTAENLAQKNQHSRHEQSLHYKDTANNANDHLRVDNASSKPLDELKAKEMARDYKRDGEIDPNKYGLNTESFVEWTDIARQSGEAALHAAVLAASLAAAPYIWKTLNGYIESGEINVEALLEQGELVFQSASSAGLRGGIAAGLTAACKSGLLGDSLKSISPSAIGMATTMTLNGIAYSIQLQQGVISRQEYVYNCMRDTFVLSFGMSGAAIGQVIIPIPVLGALVGNFVGSTLGAITFEGANHIIMGICVESGWTFFGLVDQDYVVSEQILRSCGYDIICLESFQTKSFSVADFATSSFNTNSLSFHPLRRGVFKCGVIGNI